LVKEVSPKYHYVEETDAQKEPSSSQKELSNSLQTQRV
jgi:hypothetical protein